MNWIKEYLEDCSQSIVIGNLDADVAKSDEQNILKQGVPQGSVFGLILFTLYISSIGDICRIYNINFHSYADDQQIYLFFKPTIKGDKEWCTTILHNCINEIWIWMHTNLLKLNDDKTEFILTGSWLQLAKVDSISLVIGQDTIQPIESAHNLRFYMVKELKGRVHINKLCSSLTWQSRKSPGSDAWWIKIPQH